MNRVSMWQFLDDVKNEAARTTALHGEFRSAHEFYAVLLEEVDELWDIVKQKQRDRNLQDMYKEIVQIAAMCAKGVGVIDKFGGGDR